MPARFPFVALLLACATPAAASTATAPFDFSRQEIAVDVVLGGQTLHMLLDTGVNPSVIDLATAERIGLAIDRHAGGEGDGFGDGKAPTVFPTEVTGLVFAGRKVARFEALASDLSALSAHYGRKLDGVLGYSFLSDKIVLIDYAAHRATLLDAPAEASSLLGRCRTVWRTRFTSVEGFPAVARFRFGSAAGPVTLDTGANNGIGLFGSALALPGLRAALAESGSVTHAGAQGTAQSTRYRLRVPVAIGPFRLPAGQEVFLHKDPGSRSERVANIGNTVLAALMPRLMLDYRRRVLTAFGGCTR